MSSESGLDSIFLARGEHLSVKDLFKRTPKAEAFETIDRLIRERLDAGGRVFVYNFAPSPFTLFGINRGTGRRGYEPVRRDDLERFLDTLKTRYRFTPMASYWEESDSPLYL